MVLSSLDIHGLNLSRSTQVILASFSGACVAQMVEHRICNHQVLCMNPSQGNLIQNIYTLQCGVHATGTCCEIFLVGSNLSRFRQSRISRTLIPTNTIVLQGNSRVNLSFSREESHLYLITDSRLIIYLSYKFKGESNPYLCPIFKGEFEAIFSRFTIEYFFKDFQCLPLNFIKGKICIVTAY